jgi:hypothetical protein
VRSFPIAQGSKGTVAEPLLAAAGITRLDTLGRLIGELDAILQTKTRKNNKVGSEMHMITLCVARQWV